jgi:hypothetical protein
MIVEAVDAYYAKRAQESGEPFRIRPSGLGDCLRKTAFLLSGAEREPLSAETARVFEHGHARGSRLEEIARDIWPDAQTQVPVEIPVPWGTMQGTIDIWIPSLLTVVDWKTVSVYGFGLLDTEGASEDYKLQIHAYRHGLLDWFKKAGVGNPYLDEMPKDWRDRGIRSVLVYEAKDSDARKGVRAGQLKEIEVPFTDELEERYQRRLGELALLNAARGGGTFDPFLVPGLPKEHWKCKVKDGKPLYCPIGPLRGRCHP